MNTYKTENRHRAIIIKTNSNDKLIIRPIIIIRQQKIQRPMIIIKKTMTRKQAPSDLREDQPHGLRRAPHPPAPAPRP